MMKMLAAYLMRGRMQAIVVTAVMAALALLLPPLSYLSGASVALVTLRHGPREGLRLCLGATVAVVVLMLPLQQPPLFGVLFALMLWLPVWALSQNLRRTASPARSVLLGWVFAAMTLVSFYMAVETPAQWWLSFLRQALGPTLGDISATEMAQVEANLASLAQLMSGVMAAGLMATLIGCLLLGRWWQALLYNPGGFGDEFRKLRLGKVMAIAGVSLVLLYLLWSQAAEGGAPLLRDLMVLLQVAFALQGVAIAHALLKQRGEHRGWLIALYLLLVLFMGQVVLLLAIVGTVDNWFDFRGKFARNTRAENE